MKTFINRIGLRWRILLTTTLILVGFLISQITYFRYFTVSFFNEEMRQSTERIVENVREDIDSFSNQIYLQLSGVYQDWEFMSNLRNDSIDYKDKLYAHNFLLESPILSKVYALYIYNNDHKLISSYTKGSSLKSPFPYNLYGEESDEEENLKRYVENGTEEMSMIGYEDTGKQGKTIRYVLRLYQDSGSSMVGYMVCDVSREDIDHIVERNRYREEQHLWLETLNEYPISFVGDTDEKTAQAIRACQSGQKAESKEYYDFVAARSKYGYRVHLLFSVPALEKNAREFLRNVLSMLLVLVMVWGIVLVLTWQKMTRQLTMMMQTIEQIEGGNIHVRFTNLYDDELGKLGEQFNHMMDEIERYIYREYQSRIILNDARYYALQAQINPHFLFNTLNTMAGIAQAEHCDKARRMCVALSDIFRYNIAGNMDRKFVTLKEEIVHVKNYLYIVEMRTMDKIFFDDRASEEMGNIRVPKLSVQPLVENCVGHGLKNVRGRKYIGIEARTVEGSVFISVSDNGTGADPQKLEAYLREESVQDRQDHTSIGLRNINERIRFLCGEEYGLAFSCEAGLKVTIHLPLIIEESENDG